jgi:MFS family permease
MPALARVIRGGRWREGYVVLAAALLALAPLLLLLQRSRPPAARPRLDAPLPGPAATGAPRRLATVVRRPRFWFTYIQYVLGPLSTTPLIVHQAALMRDRGMGEMQAAWVVAFFGLSALIGMIAAGALSDRSGRERAYTLGTVGIIAGCAALLALPGRAEGSGGVDAHAIAYAVLFGFGFGTRPSMDAATVADIFRGPGFGLVYGVLSTALGIGQLASPVLAGAIHDATGSYDGAILFCIAAAVVATASIWLAAPRRGLEPA